MKPRMKTGAGNCASLCAAGRLYAPETEMTELTNQRLAIGAALLLMASGLPAPAQTATVVPFAQTSALPPPAASYAVPGDPNAPRWMLLEGYDGGAHVSYRWWLVELWVV